MESLKSLVNQNISEMFITLKDLRDKGCMFQYFDDKKYNGRTITINGKEMLYFASCSYLGIENRKELIEKSIEAVKSYGSQTPSSRAALSSPLYAEIEKKLFDIFPGNHIITQTVTLGHFSVLPLLIQENDAIILDGFVHNSIRMASQWCKANGTFIVLSRHNDMENVRYLYKRLKKQGYRKIWYCADGIYSMHGNFLDVEALTSLLDEEEDFYAYVDDAHGSGWCGRNGCGYYLSKTRLHPKVVLIVSFAKSFASCGGAIIVEDNEIAEMIRLMGQTMIFSGPIQPSTLGSLLGSIEIHLSDELQTLQNDLIDRILYFRNKSKELNLSIVTKDISPIQLLKIGNVNKTIYTLQELVKCGFYTISAVYPAVSIENSGIRITLTRHIKYSDIDLLLTKINEIL